MAIIAIIAARDMRWVFAGCGGAVVAGPASAQNMRVINDYYGLKCARVMAVFAHTCRLNMCRAFADSGQTVMAGDAIADDPGMVKYGRQPAGRIVAIVALIVGRNVSRCLAGRLDAVVAAHATSGERRVIDKGDNLPTRRIVAIRAFANG